MFLKRLIFIASLCHVALRSDARVDWLSKSLDNFGLKNCSFFERTSIIGDFHTCSNQPGWKEQHLNVTTATPLEANSTEIPFIPQEWPSSLCQSIQNTIDCFPLLLDHDCYTPTEAEFFQKTLQFFQAQHEYACQAAENISEIMKNSSCAFKSSIDSETICFSMTTNKYKWVGWPLNYEDNQMCYYFIDLRECEVASYKDCPPEVSDFVEELWNVGMRVIPCPSEKEVPTTTHPKKPWDDFINNEFNWNSNSNFEDQWNPMKKKPKKGQKV